VKTLAEIQNLAVNMAEMHFYVDYDNKMAWEPYQNYPEDWVEEQMENMAEMLERVMLWAQRDTLAG
jgi:hypothetical protein